MQRVGRGNEEKSVTDPRSIYDCGCYFNCESCQNWYRSEYFAELLLKNDKFKVESRPFDPPLSRKLFLVTHGTPTVPAVKAFVERLPALIKGGQNI